MNKEIGVNGLRGVHLLHGVNWVNGMTWVNWANAVAQVGDNSWES